MDAAPAAAGGEEPRRIGTAAGMPPEPAAIAPLSAEPEQMREAADLAKAERERIRSAPDRSWPAHPPPEEAPPEPDLAGRADRLDRMYAALRRVMAATGIGSGGYPRDGEGQVAALCTAIIQEAAELQNETAWKWRKRRVEPFGAARAGEELVDILYFAVQAAIVLGLTPDDLLAEYERKAAVNARRQQEGY